MSQFPICVTVTNVLNTWADHLWDAWVPAWATVSTDAEAAAKIKAAYNAACIDGFAGIVAPLTKDDLEIAFASNEGEPIRVRAQFFTVVVTCQGMRIELFDHRMELENHLEEKRTPAYIRIECGLNGLI